jgi:hypothetical protein
MEFAKLLNPLFAAARASVEVAEAAAAHGRPLAAGPLGLMCRHAMYL